MRRRAWHQIRAQIRGVLLITLIAGLGTGAVLAAAIGARRTDTAYPRFIRGSRESDVLVGVGCPPPMIAPCGPIHAALHRMVLSLPQVAISAGAAGLEVFAVDHGHIEYNTRVINAEDPGFGHSIYLEKLFGGRFPEANDAIGIVVNRPLALTRHYHVGQILTDFRAFPGENRPFKPEEGVPVTLRVAAIALGQNEVLTDANTPSGLQILTSPAFVDAHPGSEAFAFDFYASLRETQPAVVLRSQ